jgi:hypothetical protein
MVDDLDKSASLVVSEAPRRSTSALSPNVTETSSNTALVSTRSMSLLGKVVGVVGTAVFFAGFIWFRYFTYSVRALELSVSMMIAGGVIAITGVGGWKKLVSPVRGRLR